MSRESVNTEGLTFEEWVCAAGVARPDHRAHPMEHWRAWPWVMPYSSSSTRYEPGADSRVLLVNGIAILEHKAHRDSQTHYPKQVREAWRGGVDPTEWRAHAA